MPEELSIRYKIYIYIVDHNQILLFETNKWELCSQLTKKSRLSLTKISHKLFNHFEQED